MNNTPTPRTDKSDSCPACLGEWWRYVKESVKWENHDCPTCNENKQPTRTMNTPTPRTETDLFEATKVSLEYGNQRLFKKSQSTRIVGEVAFSDGYEYALKHSSKIKQLERELAAAREEITLLKTNLKIQTNHTENAVQDRADEHIELHNQIHELREQRDRLAEWLKWIAGWNHQLFDENTAMQMRDKAEQALQSLNQTTP